MQKPLSIFICAITGMTLLAACQSEPIQDKVAKVNEKTKPALGKYWPAGVPQPSDLEVGSGGDLDLQKMDLLQYWPKGSHGVGDQESDDQWRQMLEKAEALFLSGQLPEAARDFGNSEDFAKQKFGNDDHRRLISHFGMVKIHAAELKLDDALAVARETLAIAEKDVEKNAELIAQIKDNIQRIEQAKAKRSSSATKDN